MSEESLIGADAPAEDVQLTETPEAQPVKTPSETPAAPVPVEADNSVYDKMIPLFKELNYTEDRAKEVLCKIISGDELDDLTNDEGLVFGKYKDAMAAEDAFKKLESENGRLRREKAPTAPDEYTFDFSEDTDMKDIIGEEYDFANDPLLQAMNPVFKESNMTQDQVNAAVKAFMKFQHSTAPDFEAEMDKLGSGADSIIKEVQTFVSRNFNESERALLEDVATTAEATKILHKISKMVSPNKPIPAQATGASIKSSAELYAEAQKIRQEAGSNFQFNTTAQALYEKKMDAAVDAESKGY